MKATDDLFILIQSLTSNEKRFFRRFSSIREGNKNYLDLFNAIDKLKEYDEQKLKKKHEGKSFIKNLAYEKVYLQKQVLRTLRMMNTNVGSIQEVNTMIEEAELLVFRGLFKSAHRLLEKAKKNAIALEAFPLLFRINSILSQAAMRMGDYDYLYKQSFNIVSGTNQEIEKFKNREAIVAISNRIFSIINTQGKVSDTGMKELEVIMKDPILENINKMDTFYGKLFFYHCHDWYFTYKEQLKKAFDINKKVITLYKENEGKIKFVPRNQIGSYGNLRNRAIQLGNYKDAIDATKEMEILLKKYASEMTEDQQWEIACWIYEGRADVLIRTQKYEEARELSIEMERKFNKNANRLNKQTELFHKVYTALAYNGIGNHKKSLPLLQEVTRNKFYDFRQDFVLIAWLVFINIHFDLKNYDILNRSIKEVTNYCKENNLNFKTAERFLFLIKALLKNENKRAIVDSLKVNAKKEMLTLKEKHTENKIIELSGVLRWLDKK